MGGVAGMLPSLMNSLAEETSAILGTGTSSSPTTSIDEGIGQVMGDEEKATDYVFHMVSTFRPENLRMFWMISST